MQKRGFDARAALDYIAVGFPWALYTRRVLRYAPQGLRYDTGVCSNSHGRLNRNLFKRPWPFEQESHRTLVFIIVWSYYLGLPG